MEKVSTKSFFWFWALLGLASVVLIWFLPWRFQTNDDELMMWLVSGAYTGEPESFAVFIHPILSWSFSKLYTFFPAIPWYPLTWFLGMFLSYLLILKVIWGKSNGQYFKNLSSLFIFCLLVHFLLFLQFTIVAGFAVFAGYCSLLFSKNTKIGKTEVLSWALFVFSILVRWESFVLISLGFGLYLFIFKLDFFKHYLIPLFSLLILFFILLSGKFFWENNSPYSEYLEYNRARASVSDHPVMYRFFKEGRIEKTNNWFYFSQWMMDDDDISVEQLKEIKNELDAEFISVDQIQSSFSRLLEVLKSEVFKSIFSFLLLLGFFLSSIQLKKKLTFFFIWTAFFLVFNHFFILNGRVIILFVLPFAFPIFDAAIDLKKAFFVFSFAILGLLLGLHVRNFLKDAKGRKIMQLEFLSILDEIHPKTLVVLEGYKENFLGIPFDQSRPVPFLSYGWISKSPFQKKALKKFELESIQAAKRYYLIGVDVHEEYFFPMYMNYYFGEFTLDEKKEYPNFILFDYQKE